MRVLVQMLVNRQFQDELQTDLSQFHVLAKQLSLLERVVGVACEVEIGKRSTWKHVSGKHLTDWLSVELESCQAHLCAQE